MLSSQNKVTIGFLSTLLLASSSASHAANVLASYSFGGGCVSQGAWTKSALYETQSLRQTVEALKNIEACKGIEGIIPRLNRASSAMQSPQSETNRMDRMESLPGELAALRTAGLADPNISSAASSILTSKIVEGATASVESMAAGSAQPGRVPFVAALAGRIPEITSSSLDSLDEIMSILPMYDDCLIGNPSQGAVIIGSTIKLAALLAGSGEGVTNRLGNSISKLLTLMRDNRFNNIIRKLDQNQFWSSMSCLLETTTQAYCSAKDGYEILKYGVTAMNPQGTASGETVIGNPLEGYYLLIHNAPIVSQWLQKIQFGITPKLNTDAMFKNRVWDTVTELYKRNNDIKASVSESLLTLETLPDAMSKRNALMTLIRNLVLMLGNSRSNGDVNFYTMTMLENKIPFFLLGMDYIPAECASNSEGRYVMRWDMWVENGGNYRPQFDDPDALAQQISLRLDALMEMSQSKASAYFRQRMVVDMPNLVTESITSQTYTVVESLKLIHKYLQSLQKRIIELNGDYAIIPNIKDTNSRITKILESYSAARQLAERIANSSDDGVIDKYRKDIASAYQNVINTAYDQFNVLLQRDSFLTTRLSTFVYYDYSLRIRNKLNMSLYQYDLMNITGKALLDKMVEVHGLNPTNVKNDLSLAQVINKRNIEAMENLLRDPLVPVLYELDKIEKGQHPSDTRLAANSGMRVAKDVISGRAFQEHPFLMTFASTLQQLLTPSWFRTGTRVGVATTAMQYFLHADRYPMYLTTETNRRGKDDEYGSFSQFKAKLCSHTLAFEDRTLFEQYCAGSVLKSAFTEHQTNSSNGQSMKLDLAYDNYMTPKTRYKAASSKDICAFRDYTRRNQVFWMLQTLNQ